MQRAEFSRLAAKRERQYAIALFAPMILLFVFATPFKIWQREWCAWLGIQFPSVSADLAMVLPACILGILMLPFVPWWLRRAEAKSGIPCPNCGKSLDGTALVKATGLCPHCNQRVLEGEAPARVAEDGAMVASDFNRAVANFRRHTGLAVLVPMGSVFGVMLLFAVAVDGHAWRAFLGQYFRRETVEWLQLAPLFAAFIAAIWWMINWSRRVERRFGIACPHCQKTLTENPEIVVATKNCPACEGRVLESRAPMRTPTPEQRPMPVAEFQRAVADYRKRSWKAGAVPMGVVLAMMVVTVCLRFKANAFLEARFPSATFEQLGTALLAGVFVACLWWMFIWTRRLDRRFGMPCPHCRQALTNASHIVLATKHCTACGEQVLEEMGPRMNRERALNPA